MSQIHEYVTVHCPGERVRDALDVYLASLPAIDGNAVVPLRVMVGDLVVERRADLSITYDRADVGREVLKVAWQAHDGGIYPVFNGTLSVTAGTGKHCRFDLEGGYVPPLGLAGKMFDAVAGHRIAVEASRALVDAIRIGVERAYADECAAA
jgi:hypothetical protein